MPAPRRPQENNQENGVSNQSNHYQSANRPGPPGPPVDVNAGPAPAPLMAATSPEAPDSAHPGDANHNASTEISSAGCFDDKDSGGDSHRPIPGSDSDDAMEDIAVEYTLAMTGEEVCVPGSILLDRQLSCGRFWKHLLDCKVDMKNKSLLVDKHVLEPYMKIILIAFVKQQLQAPPAGVLRIIVVCHAV